MMNWDIIIEVKSLITDQSWNRKAGQALNDRSMKLCFETSVPEEVCSKQGLRQLNSLTIDELLIIPVKTPKMHTVCEVFEDARHQV